MVVLEQASEACLKAYLQACLKAALQACQKALEVGQLPSFFGGAGPQPFRPCSTLPLQCWPLLQPSFPALGPW